MRGFCFVHAKRRIHAFFFKKDEHFGYALLRTTLMLKVGLTGGIASGKTEVARMFTGRGAHVIHADRIAHDLMRPGQPVYEEVARHFGPNILAADGTIDRPKLAAAAFTPDGAGHNRVEELNRIVHPAVIRYQDEWAESLRNSDPDGIAIIEAALIFEAGADLRFDQIVVVVCRPEQKAERFAARSGLNLEAARTEVERRSAAQWPDNAKAKAADFVIDNSGSLADTENQVETIFRELKRIAVRDAKTVQK
jgi:dephospho-CoA kinase